MPHVEGESLREKLNREKQLSIEETLEITRAVASALDSAHRNDVIHRDIKPENILLEDGQPVVADFGIALAVSAAGGTRLTDTGLSLGTPEYMSPEQATGDREVDARSDVYALGSVVYEMLVGEPPHSGPTVQAVFAKVLSDKPRSVRELRDTVPWHIEAALEKALAKLPADRFASATAFADALVNPSAAMLSSPVAPPGRAAQRRRLSPALGVLGGLLTFLLGGAIGWLVRPQPAVVDRLEVHFPRGQRLVESGALFPTPYALPDGSGVVYSGVDASGIHRIYRRMLGSAMAEVVSGPVGTQAQGWAFPSPDGEMLALLTVPGLRTFVMALGGGEPTLVTDSLSSILAWGPDDGMIYGVHGVERVVARVAPSGGPIELLATRDSTGETNHWMPQPLPGGKGILITIRRGEADAHVAVVDAAGRARQLTQGFGARYAESGYIVFARVDSALYAAPFDADRLELRGDPVQVVRDVAVRPGVLGFFALFSLSLDGSLVYLPASQSGARDGLTWIDRSGSELTQPVEHLTLAPYGLIRLVIRHPRLSPDGARVAFEGRWSIYIYDFASRTPFVLPQTVDSIELGWVRHPSWRDARTVMVSGIHRGGSWYLYDLPLDRSQPAKSLFPGGSGFVQGEPRPGGGLVFVHESRDRGSIFYSDPGDESEPIAFGDPAADEHSPALSPDGRWLAYVSSGDVWLAAFPDGSGRVQVSSGGGTEPRWAHSSTELFYRTRDSLIVADVRTTPQLDVGTRRGLFAVGAYEADPRGANYDVAPDDQRFLFVKNLGGDGPQYMVVERRWAAKLDALVGQQTGR
jgi:serine/threonine-protein kinase